MKWQVTKMKNSIWNIDFQIIGIFILGMFLRLALIGNIPGNGMGYVDETFSGYEAFSMLHYGHDTQGYVRPVYLVAWGGGMSALQAYIQMPFVWLFGNTTLALRLPMAIFGCVTMMAFYFLCKELYDKQFAKWGLFILAIMPWHIMLSRWGLDCNYFPGLLLLAILFLTKSSKNSKFFPLSMLFFAISLYSYAAPWIVMPFVVIGGCIWLVWGVHMKIDRYIIGGSILFCLLATPLMLFLLVNYGIIPEIDSLFISIPKLDGFRGGEVSFALKSFINRFYNLYVMITSQSDGGIASTTKEFGMYYKFSNYLIIIGMGFSAYNIVKKVRQKKQGDILLWIQLFAAFILAGCIEGLYIYRMNIIQIPITFFCALGCYEIEKLLGERVKYVIVTAYFVGLVAFMSYYLTEHDNAIAKKYHDGVRQAVLYLEEHTENGEKVHLLSDVGFPNVLYYGEIDTEEYMKTVVYSDDENVKSSICTLYPVSFCQYIMSFTNYKSNGEYEEFNPNDYYVVIQDDEKAEKYLEEHNLDIMLFGDYVKVGYVNH